MNYKRKKPSQKKDITRKHCDWCGMTRGLALREKEHKHPLGAI